MNNQGFSIMEVLVGILLLATMGLGLTMSTTMATRSRAFMVRDSAAMQVAMEGLEQLSLSDPSGLDSSDSSTSTVERAGYNYSRTISIAVNADNTRSVAVTVSGAGTTLTLNEILMPWSDS